MARKIQKKNSVFKQTFRGGWIKEIVQRSGGMRLDAYVYSPSGKKLQSKSELFEFVRENTKYLKNLDPTEVNFSKHHGETRPAAVGPLITKFIQEIETLKMDSGLIEDNNNPLLDGKSECCKGYC